MILGERVKKLRNSLGLTQKEFASRVPGKISDTWIGKIERGYQYPSLKLLERIGKAYSVPVSYFFFEEAVKLPVHIVSKPFICPLSPVIKIRGDENRWATCDGLRCDWWDKDKRRCVIWTIADILRKR